MRVKKGDTVVVIAGKDKGKKGTVVKVMPKTNRVIVEGVNVITKHQKPNAMNPQGGIVNKEASIHISNVMPLDPETGKGPRVESSPDPNQVWDTVPRQSSCLTCTKQNSKQLYLK